jgi:hypothetical protein
MKKLQIMVRLLMIFLFLLGINSINFAQSTVKGVVKDGSNSDPVENAKITLVGSEKRCLSDANGVFELSGIPKGKYSLEIKASTFNVYVLSDVTIGENEVKELNIAMEAADLVKGPVVVTRKVKKDGNIELIRVQHNLGVVSNGISAEDIKKTNDSKVSDVMKRISGASIQDNKFIVIRGLSDRYNYAFLNGASLPSSESDRKAFSFDIFPSNILSSISVIKTASPSMPGEFAGGIINITTIEPSDKPINSLSLSAGYNSISTFRNFYRSGDSKLDILGFGGKDRLLPTGIPGSAEYAALDIHERARWAQKMNYNWSPSSLKINKAWVM